MLTCLLQVEDTTTLGPQLLKLLKAKIDLLGW